MPTSRCSGRSSPSGSTSEADADVALRARPTFGRLTSDRRGTVGRRGARNPPGGPNSPTWGAVPRPGERRYDPIGPSDEGPAVVVFVITHEKEGHRHVSSTDSVDGDRRSTCGARRGGARSGPQEGRW